MPEQISAEFNVPATMRDGTILRANVFRPTDSAEQKYPVALTRTPYGKDYFTSSPFLDAARLARAGYIVVIQDVRGKFSSEGDWQSFANEARDGYDTVEWAAQLPGSNGNVGMFGASYFGFTQWMTARENPPHLKAIVPAITWADVCEGVFWRNGALELGTMAYWQIAIMLLEQIMRRHRESPLPEKMAAIGAFVQETNRLQKEGYLSLPLNEFEPFKRLGIEAAVQEVLQRGYNPADYRDFSIGQTPEKITVPAYLIGGWYDIFTKGTLDNFQNQRNSANPLASQSRLLIGPWSHSGYSNVVGEIDFGFAASSGLINLQYDFTGLTQRWFDYWLKSNQNGLNQEAPIKLFVMGANIWRDEQEWPLARTQYTPFYLQQNGLLSTEKPGEQAADQYTYDPTNPTPTLGGSILMSNVFQPGPKDQRPLETRSDLLVYTSAPLEADLEVTGPVAVKLWAASDASDTDFVARLVDVHPDGFSQNLTDGIIRARYRNGSQEDFLEPGQAYEFTIDLWATSNLFKKGHCIRLHIASASFPRWDRNPNTGQPLGADSELRPARQTILHDAEHLSQVILPVIPPTS